MSDHLILVVEDDENDVFFLQTAFKRAGILTPLHVACDGQQALNYLNGAGEFADRAQSPVPSLVLLDLKLPQVMGLEVLKWIRLKLGLSMPVIILSASNNEADVEQAYRFGANAYLVKPNEGAKLLDMARAIKDFWLTHNSAPEQSIQKQHSEDGLRRTGSRTLAEHRDRASGQNWPAPEVERRAGL